MKASKKSEQEEMIFLDAEILDTISNRAFRARLANGHEFVAYCRDPAGAAPIVAGARVTVRVSPFDFSTGEVVSEKGTF